MFASRRFAWLLIAVGGVAFAADPVIDPAPTWSANFAPVANMGFADETAGDGRGGWSDQGWTNSFAEFDVTQRLFGGVPFQIVDPAHNAGTGILSFRHRALPTGVAEATAALPPGAHGRYLYLLHTACWTGTAGDQVGVVTVNGASTERKIDVQLGRDVADWWNPSTLPNGAVVVSKPNQSSLVGVYLSRFDLGADLPASSVTFQTTQKALWIVIGATLTVADVPLPADTPLIITAGAEWKALASDRLVVQPGTALDYSAWVDHAPAGIRGRVITRPDGHLAFADAPTVPVRFFGCSGPEWMFATPERTDPAAYAEAVRRQGYNLVRFHFLDSFLAGSTAWGKAITPSEIAAYDARAAAGQALDPAALAVLDRLVAELKQRGIYLFLDAMTSWTGYYPVNPWTDNNGVADLKLRMYADPVARAHYRAAVTQLLTHRNPLTGTTLAEDPQVAVVLGHNETAIDLYRDTGWKTILLPPWRRFLSETYADPAAWRAAWGGGPVPTTFAEAPMFALEDSWTEGARRLDVARFLAGLETETADFMHEVVRSAGYHGVFTNYDHYKNLRYYLARSQLDAVTMHAYHAHPSNYIVPGSKILQVSSLADGLGWWRSLMASRIAGRPQLFTEYGHVYWNRYRYEEGLAVGAYAAFQDVDMLLAHAHPVLLKTRPIKSFSVANDPVARASQVVTGLTWRNRAVAPARHRLDVRITRADALLHADAAIAGEQNRLALLTGFATSVEGGPDAPPADLTIPLMGGAQVVNTAAESRVTEQPSAAGVATSFAATVAELRRRELLPRSNRTDPERGTYESDTGELLLQSNEHRLIVATSTVAGITIDPQALIGSSEFAAGALHLHQVSVPASLTAAALDGRELSVAHRILLVVATDARNANEEYADSAGVVMKKLGTAPVLVHTGKFSLRLDRAADQPALQAWALALDGTRQDALTVTVVAGGIELNFDTGTWACGPTPYIELAVP